jgi:signal peptidase I
MLVRKSGKYTPKRGDVIVFKSPMDPNVLWVKRVVAFGGESVEIKNKTIHLNAKKIQSPIIQNIKYVSMGKFGLEWGLYIVPKGSVFVLGDNSNNSRDSRFYGAIPKSEIVGRAYKIYWPPKRIGLLY